MATFPSLTYFAMMGLVNIAATDLLVLALVECSKSPWVGILATSADKLRYSSGTPLIAPLTAPQSL